MFNNSAFGEIIEMSPLDFLARAALSGGYNKKENRLEMGIDYGDDYSTTTVKYLIHKIKEGYCFGIPRLVVEDHDNGLYYVDTHEGRHRLMAAYYLNIDKVKVGIEHLVYNEGYGYYRRAHHRSMWKPIQNINTIITENQRSSVKEIYGALSINEWKNTIKIILERNRWRFEGIDLEDYEIDKDSYYERHKSGEDF